MGGVIAHSVCLPRSPRLVAGTLDGMCAPPACCRPPPTFAAQMGALIMVGLVQVLAVMGFFKPGKNAKASV